MTESRYQFPGFLRKESRDSRSREVEAGTIEDGETVFELEVSRSKLRPGADWRVNEIRAEGSLLWSEENYKKIHKFDGLCVVARAPEFNVLTLTFIEREHLPKDDRGEWKVSKVIPFENLLAHQPPGMRRSMMLKYEIAKSLGRKPMYTLTEHDLMNVDGTRQKAMLDAEHERAREERQNRRIERIKLFLSRGRMTAFNAVGDRRFGFPVMKDEWMSLLNRTPCILVDSIEQVEGGWQIGKPIEFFRVLKEPGRTPQKAHLELVSDKRRNDLPIESVVEQFHSHVIIVEKEDEAYEVYVFPDQDAIRKAQEKGLNSGTLVTTNQKDKEGRYQIDQLLTSKGRTTWGLFKSLI